MPKKSEIVSYILIVLGVVAFFYLIFIVGFIASTIKDLMINNPIHVVATICSILLLAYIIIRRE